MSAYSKTDVVTRPVRLLCVALGDSLLSRFTDAVDLYGCWLDGAAGTGVAVLRLIRGGYDAVVLQHDLPAAEIQAFLAWLRAPKSSIRTLPVLLVASREDLAAAEHFLGRGATRILDAGLAPHMLHLVLGELLNVAPRFQISTAVRLGPPAPHHAAVFGLAGGASKGRTVNVSASGMLVETDRSDPPGSLLPFELELPEESEPLRGWAEVVRNGQSPTDRDPALGLRIRSFSRDGVYRYNAYLDRQSA